uniref:Immunoglobulin domain-containing protein n=1 Tax=Xiphophorus couchianus TaxID=32473 RepID=A0A3B5M548_9TELE
MAKVSGFCLSKRADHLVLVAVWYGHPWHRCCDKVNKIQSIEEGSVTISCPYDSESVDKLKFLCRGNRPSTCRQQAVITSSNTQNGRFRLSDDRKSRIFTVTISSLTLKDSGSYLCGVQRNSGFDDLSAVELEVKGKCAYNSSRHEHKQTGGSRCTRCNEWGRCKKTHVQMF